METKNSIRKEILALRGAVPMEERVLYSGRIKENVLCMEELCTANTVLAFAGYGSEVITTELVQEFLQLGKRVYLPRVNGEEMDFYRIESLGDLEEGYKGIPEPKANCKDIYKGTDFKNTVMLMPGVVFSPDGSRIGYGKGYYDRYLEKYDIMNRIAICFSVQIKENIPSDAHDKKASVIVSEKGITECRKVNY